MMYAVGTQNKTVYQYNANLSQATSNIYYANKSYSVATEVDASAPSGGREVRAIEFNSSGSKMFIGTYNSAYATGNMIFEYTLNTPWDVSTASYSGTSFQGQFLMGMSFKNDGTKLYTIDYAADEIRQHTTGSSNVFNTPDVGKIVTGNSGSATITSTAGAYSSITAFADTSAISSWTLTGAQGKSDGSGINLTGVNITHQLASAASNTTHNFAYGNGNTQINGVKAMQIKPDGTKLVFLQYGGSNLSLIHI